MKNSASVFAAAVGLGLLAALGWACWLAIGFIVDAFGGLDRELANLTAMACVVSLLAAWTVARGGLGPSERRRRQAALHNEQTATYQLFVDVWQSLLRRGRGPGDVLPVDLAGKLQVLDRWLALYGSTHVLRAHTALRALEREHGARHDAVREGFVAALVAMRKDLGADVPPATAAALERLLLAPAAQG